MVLLAIHHTQVVLPELLLQRLLVMVDLVSLAAVLVD